MTHVKHIFCQPLPDNSESSQVSIRSFSDVQIQPKFYTASPTQKFWRELPKRKSLSIMQGSRMPNTIGNWKRNEAQRLERSRSSRSSRSSSSSSSRRSVPGMKELLPLMLTSTMSSEFVSRPPLISLLSPTFGSFGSPIDGQPSRSSTSTEYFDPAYDHNQNTTIPPEESYGNPIYSEPSSPGLSRAYFNEDGVVRFNSSPSGSTYDESRFVQTRAYFNEHDVAYSHSSPAGSTYDESIITDYESSADLKLESESRLASLLKERNERCQETPGIPSVNAESHPRHSGLSFQCLGDLLLVDESAWIGRHNRLNSATGSSDPLERAGVDIDGWISDSASSTYGDLDTSDDLLACATALAPARAHVVDVNGSGSCYFDFSRVPPRSSSLVHECAEYELFSHGRPSQMGSHRGFHQTSQALEDIGEDENEGIESPEKPRNMTTPISIGQVGYANSFTDSIPPDSLPPSPPLTNETWDSVAGSSDDFPFRVSTNYGLALAPSHSYFTPDVLPPYRRNQIAEILRNLKAAASGFPDTMLLLYSPTMSAIRTNLLHQRICPSADYKHFTGQPSPTPVPPPSYAGSWFSEQTPSFYQPIGTTAYTYPPFHPQHGPPLFPPARLLSSPDLGTLYNIFPDSTDVHRSALYAHILAWDFMHCADVKTYISSARPMHISTWEVPAKAASTLGMLEAQWASPLARSPVAVHAEAIELALTSCISKMLRVMEEDEDNDGMVDLDCGTPNMVFVRALVEIVRACELSTRELT